MIDFNKLKTGIEILSLYKPISIDFVPIKSIKHLYAALYVYMDENELTYKEGNYYIDTEDANKLYDLGWHNEREGLCWVL